MIAVLTSWLQYSFVADRVKLSHLKWEDCHLFWFTLLVWENDLESVSHVQQVNHQNMSCSRWLGEAVVGWRKNTGLGVGRLSELGAPLEMELRAVLSSWNVMASSDSQDSPLDRISTLLRRVTFYWKYFHSFLCAYTQADILADKLCSLRTTLFTFPPLTYHFLSHSSLVLPIPNFTFQSISPNLRQPVLIIGSVSPTPSSMFIWKWKC